MIDRPASLPAPRSATAFVLGTTVLAALTTLAWPTTAHAAPNARLVYGRGPGAEACPDEVALRRAVASRVGYDPFFPYASRSIVLTIRADANALTARVELVENGQANTRELTTADRSCAELFESAALAIAIAIDPHALVGPAPSPEPAANTESPPDAPPGARSSEAAASPVVTDSPPTRDAVATTTDRGDARRGAGLRLMLGPRIAAGLQPGLAAGLGVGGALVWERVSVGIEVESYLPSTATSASGASARGWLLDGALIPCARLHPLSLCGVGRFGRFEGAGENVVDPTTDATAFIGLGGRAEVELPLSGAVSAHLGAELVGRLSRPSLVAGTETVWEASRIAGIFAAATSYRF